MRTERPDDLARLAIDDGDEVRRCAKSKIEIVGRKALIALVEPVVRSDRLQIVDVEIVGIFRRLDQLQLLGREADLVEMIGSRPGARRCLRRRFTS